MNNWSKFNFLTVWKIESPTAHFGYFRTKIEDSIPILFYSWPIKLFRNLIWRYWFTYCEGYCISSL